MRNIAYEKYIETLEASFSLIDKNTNVYKGYHKYEGRRNSKGEPHGYGKITYLSDETECAESGAIFLLYSEGDIYEGDFLNGKRNGFGKQVKLSGTIYEGEWKEDLRNGKGKLIMSKNASDNPGSVYEGDFRNWEIHGFGKMVYLSEKEITWETGFKAPIYSKGDSYEGDFRFGNREGFGKQVKLSGTIYEGEWENDLRHGKGKLIMSKNAEVNPSSVYEGNFQNFQKHGFGKMICEDGEIYQGEWTVDLFYDDELPI